jgi:hypothetical protein
VVVGTKGGVPVVGGGEVEAVAGGGTTEVDTVDVIDG